MEKIATISELNAKLVESGINPTRYYIQGLFGSTDDNDKLALIIKKERYLVEYEVYFRERGEKQSARIFSTECEACTYMYERFYAIKDLEDKYSK